MVTAGVPSWRWGELPNTPSLAPPAPATPATLAPGPGAELGEEADTTDHNKPAQETSAENDSGGSKKSWFGGWSKTEETKKEQVGVYLDEILDTGAPGGLGPAGCDQPPGGRGQPPRG